MHAICPQMLPPARWIPSHTVFARKKIVTARAMDSNSVSKNNVTQTKKPRMPFPNIAPGLAGALAAVSLSSGIVLCPVANSLEHTDACKTAVDSKLCEEFIMRSDISTQVDGPSTTSIESGPNLLEALATGAVLGFGAGYVVAKSGTADNEAVEVVTQRLTTEQGKVKDLEAGLATAQTSIDAATAKATKLAADLSNKEGSIISMQSKLDAVLKQAEEQQARAEKLSAELAAATQALQDQKDKGTTITADLDTKQDELATLRAEGAALSDRAEAAAAEAKTLKAKVATLTTQREAAQSALDLARREVEALKASVRKLESDTTGDKLSKKVAELTEALEETNGAVALKQKVVSRLTEQLAAAQTEAEKAAQELTQTTTRTQAELDRATESKEALEMEVKALNAVVSGLQDSSAALAKELNNSKAQQLSALTTRTLQQLKVMFPDADLKDLYKTDLPKVKAYVNYKRRGVFDRRSTAEEMQEDWDLACAEIEDMTLKGFTEMDFLAEFCRVAAALIKEGDWTPFVVREGSGENDVRRGVLSLVLEYFASTTSGEADAPDTTDDAEADVEADVEADMSAGVDI